MSEDLRDKYDRLAGSYTARYADPDAVALTTPQAGLADEVPLLREVGKRETQRILDRPPLTSVVWPPSGRLTWSRGKGPSIGGPPPTQRGTAPPSRATPAGRARAAAHRARRRW